MKATQVIVMQLFFILLVMFAATAVVLDKLHRMQQPCDCTDCQCCESCECEACDAVPTGSCTIDYMQGRYPVITHADESGSVSSWESHSLYRPTYHTETDSYSVYWTDAESPALRELAVKEVTEIFGEGEHLDPRP